MKLNSTLIASVVTAVAAKEVSISTVRADSKFGMDILSKSRRLDEDVDITWMTGFALKFQGCHHISQWNADAEDDEDVRIETKRLARFRLCPVSSCSDSSGAGCKSGYGDYIVDMDEFLYSYMENKEEVEQAACESYAESYCSCDGDDVDDVDTCEYNCFSNEGMTECADMEKYYENQGYYGYQQKLQMNDYLECAAYEAGGRRKLEDAEEENAEYYIGPYCSDQGGAIVLGMFTDDTCTEFADDYGGRITFRSLSGGQELPYSTDSMVDTKCYSCEEENDYNYGYAEPKEVCTGMYETSGKCETNLYYASNENGCNYMEGIKITRSDGLIFNGAANSNKVASAFIGIFAVSFVLLGTYVYYLKTKLDRGSIDLS